MDMQQIESFIEIQSDEKGLGEEIFQTENESKINLGKGITVFKISVKDKEIQMKILIIKDTNSYKSNITPTILGNIISCWMVYKLTGKKNIMKIDGVEISSKKNSVRKYFENKIEELF
jgi:hypothetical protein